MNNKKIESYGYTDFYKRQVEELTTSDRSLIPARVIEVHREQYKIATEFGEKTARLKGSLFYNGEFNNEYPVVGDFVLVQQNLYGEDVIYHVLKRKSKFSRIDSFNEIEQVIATNFDYVFVMTSLNHDFNIRRLERYLTIAWQSGAMPIIILTKIDLCKDYVIQKSQIEQIAAEVHIIAVSSYTGEGLDEVREYIKPFQTIVFLGSSGVGKSSLVNAIAGEEIMKVNSIREDDSKGRHTTTHRQLVMLGNGTMIIDTPGMRELGMWDVSEGLDTTFTDIEELSRNCKFADCNHENEPGCAVKKALANGDLTSERWKNYIKLKKEAKFAEWKESVGTRLKKKAHHKNIAKFQREYYKNKK
ncbi:ribosome small subunit-dependent GTPase A [Alkaliphilus sp. MSJ-5]|uniref:Small ribosomal subunit biogenesis GTPase RsgA n=1 Tax=Alkaliphilus flagellatus TaxID=2841507 RepID=A0ABS6FYK5_9FIRM|nr:ribosome small subunit-dependent GTPase A [Alkaliphilus flagellatus]MBU5675338.1 ribosome small subunit-dependent GTPase A [Alkaliphilus flagellatus]